MSGHSEEELQSYIDAAVEGKFYYDVRDPTWKKTSVIRGAARRWTKGEDYVLSPGGRLSGPKNMVEEKLEEYNIDDRLLYINKESPGYKEELAEYIKSSRVELPTNDEIEELKKSIKKTDKLPLKVLIKKLPNGRVIDVTDIDKDKLHVVNSPLMTSPSRYVGVPSIAIVSKSRDSYIQALDELGISQERKNVLLPAFDALYKLRKQENIQSVKVRNKK